MSESKAYLRIWVQELVTDLYNRMFEVIDKFPENPELHWGMPHLRVALIKYIENEERTPEELIKYIKRSYLCFGEKWHIDGTDKRIPLTEKEEKFNEGLKK